MTIGKWSNLFIEEESTAVQDPHLFEDITVFPNAAIYFTYININNSEGKTYEIRLSTMSGKQLQSTSFEGHQYIYIYIYIYIEYFEFTGWNLSDSDS